METDKDARQLTWTMNCVLFGAKIIKLVKNGNRQEAIEEIKSLSSIFDDKSATYLFNRLADLI